jgi:1-acyl-sn-glycerol-3-phosphate acyltransferase
MRLECSSGVFKMASFEAKLKGLEDKVLKVPDENSARKALYSDLELLLLDHESDKTIFCKDKDGELVLVAESQQVRVNAMRKQLRLQAVHRGFRWWYWLDKIFRFSGVCSGFFTISVFFSLPILVLQRVDDLLGLDPFARISDKLRKFVAQFILLLAGIVFDVHGLDHASFSAPCVVFAFTHASNLDGMLISSTCPVRHYSLAKKELFFVPFFSWISFAIGGIPVDRGNRERAIGALRRCSEAAASAKSCIVIAPEGTRSTTGNLLTYKKGPFHVQKQLDAPIVPFVIYGAYDLYPVGTWVNQCGRVAVRYLPPITSADAPDMDGIRRLYRRRVLEALKDTPAQCCSDLSASQWLSCYVANLVNFAFVWWCLRVAGHYCFQTLGLTTRQAATYSCGVVFSVTFFLFVYFTYVVDFLDRSRLGTSSAVVADSNVKKSAKAD